MLSLFKRRKSTSFIKDNPFPIIKAELLGRKVLLLVDSGSDLCYLDKEFFDSTDFKGEIIEGGIVITAAGETVACATINTSVIINDTEYAISMRTIPLKDKFESLGRTPAERPVGMIGTNFLHLYCQSLDFEQQRLYFKV